MDKGSCFLRKAAGGGGSPTTSARQQAKTATGGAPVSRTFVEAKQSLNKLVAKFNDLFKKQVEDEGNYEEEGNGIGKGSSPPAPLKGGPSTGRSATMRSARRSGTRRAPS